MTTSFPPREVSIDEDLLGKLLRRQRPHLAELPRTIAFEGWDNVLVRLGSDRVVRMPRRAVAADLVRKEATWLPTLAPRLPIATPVPEYLGYPDAGYPWPWSICPWIAGERATSDTRTSRGRWARDLASVLAALHHPAPQGAPHNPYRGVGLATRDEVAADRLIHLARRREAGIDVATLHTVWQRGLAAPPWPGPPMWVHGDPHPGNLLIAGGQPQSLVALLDFGDLTAGDPACDLATAWLTFDSDGRDRFQAAYDREAYDHAATDPSASGTTADPGRWERAAAWALLMASAVLVTAPDDPANATWARETLVALSQG